MADFMLEVNARQKADQPVEQFTGKWETAVNARSKINHWDMCEPNI
jgi:hypothetical protein